MRGPNLPDAEGGVTRRLEPTAEEECTFNVWWPTAPSAARRFAVDKIACCLGTPLRAREAPTWKGPRVAIRLEGKAAWLSLTDPDRGNPLNLDTVRVLHDDVRAARDA